MNPFSIHHRSLLPGTALAALLLLPAHAANVWDGGAADNNWTSTANWDNNALPTFPAALTFGGTARLAPNNNITNLTLNGLTFDAGSGAFTIAGNAFALAGNVTNNSTALQTLSPNLTLGGVTRTFTVSTGGGNITLNKVSTGTIALTGAGTLNLNGTTDNAGFAATVATGTTLVLNKTSAATVHAVGSNTTGLTVATGGTAQLSGSGGDQIYINTDVVINGTLDLNGRSEGFDGLTGAGTVHNNAANTTATLTLGQNNEAAATFTGILKDGAAGRILALTKVGTGTLTLSGANTYSGNTTVSGGTLSMASAGLGDRSKVDIAATATLNLTHAESDTIGSLVIGGVTKDAGTWGAVGNVLATNQDSHITGTGLLVVVPADMWWDGEGGGWPDQTSWSLSSTAGAPNPSAVPDASIIAHFNASTATTDQVVSLNGSQAARGLTFEGTTTTVLQGGSADHTLNLGSSGIVNTAGAGTMTIGSITAGQQVNLVLDASQTWNNASANVLAIENGIDLGGNTLTLTGRAPALRGPITGTGALVNNAGTGSFELTGANAYTGGTTVSTGNTFVSGDNSAANGGWSIGPSSANTTNVSFDSGSIVTVAAGKQIRIANTTAAGTVNQTLNAAGTVTNAGTLYLGRPGVLNINDGAIWTQEGTMSINGFGGYTAFMNVNAGGSFSYTGSTSIALNPATENTANAILTLNGGTFTTGVPFLFGASTGPVGGTPGTGRVLLTNGGTLKLAAAMPALTTGADAGFIAVGSAGTGGIIDTNGFDAATDDVIRNKADINLTVFETGSLTKAGAGTLTLTAASTYTGNTSVTGGTLSLAQPYLADTSTLTIGPGAKLHLTHGATDTVAALVLGDTPQGPGTYSAATHPAFITGSGSIFVPVADPFVAWIDTFPGITLPADKAKDADPDKDGLINLLEFAFDSDPSAGAASTKRVFKIANVSGSDYLTLTLPVRSGAAFSPSGTGPLIATKDGLNYAVKGSTDLSGFTTGVVEVTPALSTDLPVLTSGWEYRSFRLATAVSATPKGFLRAEASATP